MLSSSGTCRLIYKRCNSIMYIQLHHQRTLSSRLTSLCQVAKQKQSLLHTNVLPFNKSRISTLSPGIGVLSGRVGMLSPTLSTLFSTTAAVLDDNPGEVVEEKVFVGGYNFNHDREYLSDLFKQFGDIRDISIPRLPVYNKFVPRPKEFRYAFIEYKSADSGRSAAQAATVTGPDDNIIEIRKIHKKDKEDRIAERRRTLFVSELADGITVDHVHDHFKLFGDVEMISIIKKIALVMYKEGADIKSICNSDHDISGTKLTVEQYRGIKRLNNNQCKRIITSGLTEDVTVKDIYNHFNAIGSVDDVRLVNDGMGIVQFNDKEDAISASRLGTHEIGTSQINVQLLGISNR